MSETSVGDLTLRPFRFDEDVDVVHGWVTHPKSEFWGMQHYSRDEVGRFYRSVDSHPHHHVLIGMHDATPAFLMEYYDPSEVELVGLFDAQPGDVGMHFLAAPTDSPTHGFTLAVLRKVMDTLFADESVSRVVVEPDVRNNAVHRLNRRVGFAELSTISMPRKTALLSVCVREHYYAALSREGNGH